MCRCTSTFSALNHCGGILLKYFCYLYEVVRTNFRRFFDFSQFLIAILQKLWHYLAKNENYLIRLKGQSFLKKTLKTASKSTNKQRHKICSNPSNEQRAGQASEREKKTDIQTPHFRTYSRRALFDLAQTLHGGRARRVHPKR